MTLHHEDVQRAARAVADATALIITAGAGMGVDSGLPDFRGDEGFWKEYPPMKTLGLSFAAMANPVWFRGDPTLAWGFYGHRMMRYRRTVPHPGFAMLQRWAAGTEHGAFIMTSNVDGQFQRAGFPAERLHEVHGSIHHLQCFADCGAGIWDGSNDNVTVDPASFRATPPLPRCPACGGLARPNVLMFGDSGWDDTRSAAQEARLDTWLQVLRTRGARPVVVECGAGTAIPTVRAFSERVARALGGTLMRINPRESAVPRATSRWRLARWPALWRWIRCFPPSDPEALRGTAGMGHRRWVRPGGFLVSTRGPCHAAGRTGTGA